MTTKRWRLMLTFGLVFLIIFSSSASAFQDIGNDAESVKILSLKERGIISGIDGEHFAPNQELNYAQGVALIVSGLELSKKNDRNDQASDAYTNVAADAWYHDVFTVALHHDFNLPADVLPNAVMTKEHYTDLLFKAMLGKLGDHAFIEPYILIADEADVDPQYMNSIQKMLIIGVASLDEKQHFYPKKPITRAEAAGLLHDTLEYIAKQEELKSRPPVDNPDEPVSSQASPVDTPEPPKQICDDGYFRTTPIIEMTEDGVVRGPTIIEPVTDCEMHGDVAVSITPVNEDVNKVRISWGQQPHPGYGISIDQIEFTEATAVVHYSKHYPDPDMMYPQVIVYPEASTYVDSKYEIELKDTTETKPIKPIKPIESIEKPEPAEGGGTSGSASAVR